MTSLQQKSSVATPTPWLLLEITTECNLRCKHCLLWTTRETPAAITTEQKLRVLDDFYAWKRHGKVIFSGGEVLLKADEVFRLAARCRELGLPATALSNATLLDEPAIARLLQSGLSQISISLDAPTAEDYDSTRGVPGTFAKAVAAIRSLVAARAALGVPLKIEINSILTRSSLPRLPEHFRFLRSLEVDGVFVFPLETTFALGDRPDPFYARERLLPNDETAAAFSWLEAQGDFLANDPADIEAWRQNIFVGAPASCFSGERNVIVDLNGEVRLCHFMEERISSGKGLGNVRDGTLREICERPETAGYRQRMRDCHEPCASLNCNRPTVI